MPTQEEMEDMPIWQNHENRITTLEVTVSGLNNKMDNVEKAVREEGKEQKTLLNRLINHHLATNKMKISKMWQVILNISGAGGLLTVVIYAAVSLLK